MNYTIDPKEIKLPKNIIEKFISISGWGNRRTFYIDKKNNESYFQVTSESNGCHRCSICQERMKLLGWKTGFHFYKIHGLYSLYQKLPGVPKNLSAEAIGEFLSLPVID